MISLHIIFSPWTGGIKGGINACCYPPLPSLIREGELKGGMYDKYTY